jgi:hypothetical protein
MATGLIEVHSGIASMLSSLDEQQSMAEYHREDVPVLKVPRDGVWEWESALGIVKHNGDLEGVFLGVSDSEHSLWPTQGVGDPGGPPPYLKSIDGRVGHKVGDDPGDLDLNKIEKHRNPDGTYDWKAIEYCQWKEINGRNVQPRAKNNRYLAILLESGEPVIIRLPGTSQRHFRKFFNSFEKIGVGQYVQRIGTKPGTGGNYREAYPIRSVKIEDPVAVGRIREHFVRRVAPLLVLKIHDKNVQNVNKTVVDASPEAVPF